MVFVLTQDNLVQYLSDRHLIDPDLQALVEIDCCSSKNFNLVATFSDQRSYLVKQKRLNDRGEFRSDFYDEWRVCHLMKTFPQLSTLVRLTSDVLHYDPQNAIIVLVFFPKYQDLKEFHECSNQFSPMIGQSIGQSIATLHRLTYQKSEYCEFLSQNAPRVKDRQPNFLHRFDRIKPDIFGTYCLDGIEFFRVLQRSTALTQAIASLKQEWHSSCLIHRDLKLDNLIIHQDWDQRSFNSETSEPMLKLIDWELFTWGDPLFDLGTLVGSYCMQWLETLVVKPGLSMSESLRLAETPLECIQPILKALLTSYFQTFPELVQERPQAIEITLKYAGFHIFRRLVHHLSRHYPFTEQSICSLQIVKRLLCNPEFSFGSLFGQSLDEFMLSFNYVLA